MSIQGTPLFDDGQVDKTLEPGAIGVEAFRRALKAGKEALRRNFEAGVPVDKLVTGRAHQVDRILRQAWEQIFSPPGGNIALVAVGGYGRGELHPHSDIDIMILLGDEERDSLRNRIEQFLRFLWDIGLNVGHSVRSLADCVREAEQDITVATNLMEARLLSGSDALFKRMREITGPDHIWPSDRFFEAKWKEQQQRHHKFHDTAYNLEPNVKEGPGGLRDIQMVGWVAKRHFDAETLHELVEQGFLTDSEYRALMDGQNFLWHVRFALHTITDRREDRLLFDYQRALALQFGYQDGEANLAVEQLMQRYYRTIKELGRLNEMLLQLFQEAILYANDPGAPVPIDKRFQARKGFLEVVRTDTFRRYPFALLELFLLMQQHPELKGVRASTIRLIRDHTHLIDEKFRADIRARSLFMEILRQPRGVSHELHRMSRYGVLAAYLPAFGRVVGRMQYDLFHVYTVDEHSLFVVRNLRRFTVARYRDEFPFCSDLIQGIAKPELLYIGGLFHDLGKGRGGDHSELGAEDARQFCLDHGLSRYDAELVAWLVRNHLLMSMTAQRRDTSDPDVINEFAAAVGDRMHLDYLYLLTVADIRATNPELWNSWRDALLLELYSAARYALERGLERPIEQEETIRETQKEARELLGDSGLSAEQIDTLWANPSADYFLYHSPEEIAWHTTAIANARREQLPLVLVRPEMRRGSTPIFVYGPDTGDQFALTTSALELLGLTIVDARIITSSNGYTLDTLMVLEETGEPIENERRIEEIRSVLEKRLREPQRYDTHVSRRQPRKLKHFEIPTRVTFERDPHSPRTVLKVSTADRPGLLSRLAKAFHCCGVKLQTARATTIGAEAEDVFYITDEHNQPLTRHAQFEELRRTIEELLAE